MIGPVKQKCPRAEINPPHANPQAHGAVDSTLEPLMDSASLGHGSREPSETEDPPDSDWPRLGGGVDSGGAEAGFPRGSRIDCKHYKDAPVPGLKGGPIYFDDALNGAEDEWGNVVDFERETIRKNTSFGAHLPELIQPR